jgi:imidazolonepropionase-like amidohydrolase
VHELGGTVGAGSDAPAGVFNLPGGSIHRELELLVRAGLTPLEAIRSATGVAGEILGRTDLGVLCPGAAADLLVVAGNPAEDILATRRIRHVIQAGRPLALDLLLP